MRISKSVGGGSEGARRLLARKAALTVFQLSVVRGRLTQALPIHIIGSGANHATAVSIVIATSHTAA